MTNRDDCISITDKTFDLTIDDSLADISGSNVFSQDLDQSEGSTAVDLNEVLTEGDIVGQNGLYDGYGGKIKRYIDSLKSTAVILSRISGNDMLSYSRDGDYSLDEVDRLANTLKTLTEGCELKLTFIQKNYKLLESVYDTLGKEHESLKKSVEFKNLELKELHLKNKELERKLHEVQDQKVQDENRNPEIVLRHQKEMKVYKRFIKELMERE